MKTVISIPDDPVESADALAREMGVPRSRLRTVDSGRTPKESLAR
jgi:hypothetical protein